jgi:hypothetical protein
MKTLAELRAMSPADRDAYLGTIDPGTADLLRVRLQNIAPLPELEEREAPAPESLNPVTDDERIEAATSPKEPKDWGKDQLNESLQKAGPKIQGITTLGAGIVQQANLSDPSQTSVGVGLASGAVKGASAGASFGIPGLIAGATFGALEGGTTAAKVASDYDEAEWKKRQSRLNGLRIAPAIKEKGGAVVEDEAVIDVPIQAEVGEMFFLPNGDLVETNADKTHKEMKRGEVSDIVPNGTYVLSNSQKKLIDLAKIKDHIVGYGKGEYSETHGNTPLTKIKVGDILGEKGKITPAEAGRRVVRLYKLIDNPEEKFEKLTNDENRNARLAAMRVIMQHQEGVYNGKPENMPNLFALGGPVTPCDDGFVWDYAKQECVVNDKGLDDGLTEVPFDPHSANLGTTGPTINPPVANPVAPTTVPGATIDTYTKDMFAPYERDIAENLQASDAYFKDAKKTNNRLYNRQRLRNLGTLTTNVLGKVMQNPNVTPEVLDTKFLDSSYQKINESEIQSGLKSMQKNQSALLADVNEAGGSGAQIASAVARTQSNLLDAEGDLRTKASQFNRGQDSMRYKRLNEITNANRNAEIGAENATRSNKNALVKGVADDTADFITKSGVLDDKTTNNQSYDNAWQLGNKMNASKSRLEMLTKIEERNLKTKATNRRLANIEEFLKLKTTG